MTATQPAPARVPLARLADQSISPAVARLLALTRKPRTAGGFTSSI